MNLHLPTAATRYGARVASATVLALLLTAFASVTLAADVTDIGFVDQGRLSTVRSFADANRQLAEYKAGLDRQFAQQIRSAHSQSDQQRIAQSFQAKLNDKQRQVLAPLFQRAQVAIASVASSRNLSVVVDKRIVIVGGQDVTQDVIDLLNGAGEPVPPVNTPMPSTVGYVDQTQIDAVPKLKSINDEFAKFRADQQQQLQAKLRGLKSAADQQAAYAAAQKAITDKQHQLIDPLVDQTRNIIAQVARKRGLVLVIDKGNLVYGGTDITSDVTSALK
jgi:outer membrane protein